VPHLRGLRGGERGAPSHLGGIGVLVKVAEVIRALERDGWELSRTRGSHRQYKHAQRPGKVTVSGKPSDTLHPKTLASILRQAGMEKP
jgi:predicted RNA binding protein YcfA (HicA-like mRNA interferase family)